MKEILKVKLSDQVLSLSEEACELLEGYLEVIRTHSGEAEAATRETAFVEHILAQQPATMVVEEAAVESAIAAIGYPEGCPRAERKPRKTKSQTPQQKTTINNGVGPLGRAIIFCGKVLLGIFLACWVLTAIGVLIGFVSLAAIGEGWADVVPIDGISPIVFAGLLCAVVVLFMGIVADLGFSLIRCKRVNLKKLATAGIIWLVFFLWLIFAAIRNADNWAEWAYTTERQLELWEDEVDRWEERMESDWEEAVLGMQGVEEWDSAYSFTFEGFVGAMKFETFCERFEEMEPYEERLEYLLLRGGKVDVKVDNHYENDRLYRTITVTSPDGDTVITSPLRILNNTPQVIQQQ